MATNLPIKLTNEPLIEAVFELRFSSKQPVSLISSKVTAIKEQKVTSLFYLPQGKGVDSDCIALLEDVQSIPFSSFNSRQAKQKLFTLSDVGFYLFLMKLSVHFCRFHEDIARSD